MFFFSLSFSFFLFVPGSLSFVEKRLGSCQSHFFRVVVVGGGS